MTYNFKNIFPWIAPCGVVSMEFGLACHAISQDVHKKTTNKLQTFTKLISNPMSIYIIYT
jgi:hypothetical protein